MKQSKKVAFVIPSLSIGGSERSLLNFVNGIKELENLSIIVIVLNKSDYTYKSLFPNDIIIIHLNVIRTIFPGSWIKLLKTLNKVRPDIVIAWSFIPNIIISLFRNYIKAKKVFISERDATLYTVRHHTKGVINSLLPIIQKKLYLRADGMILNSRQNLVMYKRFLKKDNSFFHFIPNAISNQFNYKNQTESINSGNLNKTDPFKILIVGRMVYQKGFDIVLEALAKFSSSNFILFAIGNGIELDSLKQLAKNLGLSQVQWLGNQINPADYYKMCDLLIFASRHEGFPNVLLEAMAYGIPVITSNCFTGPIEMTENGKWAVIFKSESKEDLILKIEEVYAHYPKYKLLAQVTKKKIYENYNFDYVKKQYQDFIIQSLLN